MIAGVDDNYRDGLRAAPMSAFQIRALVIIVALCALDGFDVFAITFAAPSLAKEMAIGNAARGLIFSSGLLGMAVGSLILSPLADLYGRRRITIISLLLMTAGTVWTAIAGDFTTVCLSRLLTGFGVGAMVAVINPLAAEYANARRRDLCVMLLNVGFPIGGMTGGLLASQLMPALGWRSIFFCASGLAMLMLVLVLLWLPEPIAGLLARLRPETLSRVNAFLARCGRPPLARLPISPAEERSRGFAVVLSRGEIGNTLRITSIYFLFILSVFYIQSWLPSLVANVGYTPSQAAMASMWMNFSGVFGALAIGFLVPKFGLKPMVIFAFLLTALAIILFGFVSPNIVLLNAMAVLIGISTIGGMTNLYAVVSRSFAAEARASGSGFVIGVGRIGSAMGPALGGLLLSRGFERLEVSLAMAVPAIIAAIIIARVRLGTHA